MKYILGIFLILLGIVVEFSGIAGTWQLWGTAHGGQLNLLNGLAFFVMGVWVLATWE